MKRYSQHIYNRERERGGRERQRQTDRLRLLFCVWNVKDEYLQFGLVWFLCLMARQTLKVIQCSIYLYIYIYIYIYLYIRFLHG